MCARVKVYPQFVLSFSLKREIENVDKICNLICSVCIDIRYHLNTVGVDSSGMKQSSN